jgi:hypothetical protein
MREQENEKKKLRKKTIFELELTKYEKGGIKH